MTSSLSAARVVVALVAALGAVDVRAQAVPLPASTPSLEVGVDHLAGPVFRLGFSPEGGATVVGRVDVGSRVAGVEFGGQWQQRVWGPLSLREAAGVGPFVNALGPAAGGVSGGGLVQLGIDVGDSVIVLGPRLIGKALLQGAVPGRVAVDGVVGARVPVSAHLAVTGALSLGLERSHAGFASRGDAFLGTAAVGLQWRP